MLFVSFMFILGSMSYAPYEDRRSIVVVVVFAADAFCCFSLEAVVVAVGVVVTVEADGVLVLVGTGEDAIVAE